MTSNHTRNVRGMASAPRCEAQTKDGHPCCSPAVAGKKRCHVHGGKGSQGRSQRQQRTDSPKANLAPDSLLSEPIRSLDQGIKELERAGVDSSLVGPFREVSRQLSQITPQKLADLAAARGRSAYHLRKSVQDRALGAMFGLAIGEVVGLTGDGFERGTYRTIDKMMGGGKLGLPLFHWAGDTAMALALMDSLTARNGMDEADLMERFDKILAHGVYSCSGSSAGIGETTKEAIARYRTTGDPCAGDMSLDNLDTGSLVRIAPVAIRYWNDPVQRRDVAARQSRTTHGSVVASDACVALADMLADAISGSSREVVLGPREAPESSPIRTLLDSKWRLKRGFEIGSSNNVVHALEAGLWCVGTTGNFQEAVLRAANLGEDCGTIAAVTGQLAGALYGASHIPGEWGERLPWQEKLLHMTNVLFDQSWTPEQIPG